MLCELIISLLTAADPKDKERAYRKLERAGVDRMTADLMVSEFYEKKGSERNEFSGKCGR